MPGASSRFALNDIDAARTSVICFLDSASEEVALELDSLEGARLHFGRQVQRGHLINLGDSSSSSLGAHAFALVRRRAMVV